MGVVPKFGQGFFAFMLQIMAVSMFLRVWEKLKGSFVIV